MTMVRRTIRVHDSDWETWSKAAEITGFSVSEWIRRQCNLVFFDKAVRNMVEHFNGSDNYKKDVSRTADVPAGRPRYGAVARREEPRPKGKTCDHGVAKGYHCWQCKGLAIC